MENEALDPRAILAALGVADRIGAVAPVSGGTDTAIWRVERAEQTYALRVFRAGEGRVARREAAIMAAPLPGVPIPTVRAAGTWRGRPALLIDWCAGRNLLDTVRAAPRDLFALARLFGETQARLHSAAPPAALVAESGPWSDWAGGGGAALLARLQAVETGPASILHFDYHPLNLMVAGRRATGLIDWANVQVGDRRADLARTATILRLAPMMQSVSATPLRLAARLLELGWRRGYRAVAGPLGGMAPFYAWAGAVLIHDLGAKLGRPGITYQSADLDPARRWTAHWRQRAGLPAETRD